MSIYWVYVDLAIPARRGGREILSPAEQGGVHINLDFTKIYYTSIPVSQTVKQKQNKTAHSQIIFCYTRNSFVFYDQPTTQTVPALKNSYSRFW